jgi:hypothetical protein
MRVASAGHGALAALAAAVLTMGTFQAAEPVAVELVRDGTPQDLSDRARSQIADGLPKLFATCSLNSRDHRQIFTSWALGTVWEETEAKDHLRLRFARPVDLRAGRAVIRVQQLLLGLHDPEFPGPDLSRDGAQVVAYVKCSGEGMIRFVCAPDVKAMMPASYHALCGRLPSLERR